MLAALVSLSLFSARSFVGLGNYINLLRDADFWQSLGVTIWYVIGTVPVSLAISLVVAVLLFQNIKGRGIFRTLFFLPNITSVVAAAVGGGDHHRARARVRTRRVDSRSRCRPHSGGETKSERRTAGIGWD